jgi:hypothetical protein
MILFGVKERPARNADQLTTICELLVLENVSTSHNLMILRGLLQG